MSSPSPSHHRRHRLDLHLLVLVLHSLLQLDLPWIVEVVWVPILLQLGFPNAGIWNSHPSAVGFSNAGDLVVVDRFDSQQDHRDLVAEAVWKHKDLILRITWGSGGVGTQSILFDYFLNITRRTTANNAFRTNKALVVQPLTKTWFVWCCLISCFRCLDRCCKSSRVDYYWKENETFLNHLWREWLLSYYRLHMLL